MIIHEKPIGWYINKLKNNEYFSIGMLGDGEWNAIMHSDVHGKNAEETIYTPDLCDDLFESLKFKADNFYFSTPEGLKNPKWSGLGEVRIDKWLKKAGVEIEFLEKDCWDRWTREAMLGPFIKQLQKMNVCIVSNKALRGLSFLNYDHFIEIGYPNCYDEIDRAVEECLLHYGKPGVYLVAMGLPAALFVQKMHGKIPNSWFLDLGSIWDAFVGIGAQRGWRAELYNDPEEYHIWKKASLS